MVSPERCRSRVPVSKETAPATVNIPADVVYEAGEEVPEHKHLSM